MVTATLPSYEAPPLARLTNFLLHPLFWAFLGLCALAALIWWVGPLIAIGESRPLDSFWSRVICIGVLFFLLFLRIVFGLWRRKRTNAKLVDGIAKGPASADREINTLNERFTKAIEVLKTAPSGGGRSLFKRGAFL